MKLARYRSWVRNPEIPACFGITLKEGKCYCETSRCPFYQHTRGIRDTERTAEPRMLYTCSLGQFAMREEKPHIASCIFGRQAVGRRRYREKHNGKGNL